MEQADLVIVGGGAAGLMAACAAAQSLKKPGAVLVNSRATRSSGASCSQPETGAAT